MFSNLKFQNANSQKGMSLVITFLIMSTMLGIVMGSSSLLFKEIKLLGNIGNAVGAFYAAESGLEKTLYLDKKQIPFGSLRGFCNICSVCPSGDCQQCQLMPLQVNGCSAANCTNCRISYTTSISEGSYKVEAEIKQGLLSIFARGFYKDSSRTIIHE